MQARSLDNPPAPADSEPVMPSTYSNPGALPPNLYLEGTDACGKDSVADSIESHRHRLFGGSCLKVIRSAGFFLSETSQHVARWQEQYPDLDIAGLLLAGVAFDLASAGRTHRNGTPHIQVSHNSIRGAAYQTAFELPLGDLFELATRILPRQYWPVALSASIPELQRRVRSNPLSTSFDFLVCNQPDKIEVMLDVIRTKCRQLGGVAIDTTHLTPSEVAAHINARMTTVSQPVRPEIANSQETAQEILDELRSRDRSYAPVTAHVEKELNEN